MKYLIDDKAYNEIISFMETKLSDFIPLHYIDVIEDPLEYKKVKYDILASIVNELCRRVLGCELSSHAYISTLPLIMNADYYCELEVLLTRLCPNEISRMSEVEELYENIIATDFTFKNGQIEANILHGGRNIQGAYFTPKELSDNCASFLFWNHIEKSLGFKKNKIKHFNTQQKSQIIGLICSFKVADISSGVGRFLISYLRVIKEFFDLLGVEGKEQKNNFRKIVQGIYAVDIDYLALDIAMFSIAEFINDPLCIDDMKGNFILGNPLLTNNDNATWEEKITIFNSGIYYSESMGVDLKRLLPKLDIILGNPPWEKVRLEEKSFFMELAPSILTLHNKKEREKWISELFVDNEKLYNYYLKAKLSYEKSKKLIKNNPYFEHSSHGELNTYALFTELAEKLVNSSGSVGLLVKTGLLSTSVNKFFFNDLVNRNRLSVVADFINKKKIFQIDGRERFCFLINALNEKNSFSYAGLLQESKEILEDKFWDFPYQALKELNPQTGMLPTIKDPAELSFLRKIYSNCSTFNEVFGAAHYGRLVHYTSHAADIVNSNLEGTLPIYEGKFIHQYDGKFSTYQGLDEAAIYSGKASARILNDVEKEDCNIVPQSRFFISKDKWDRITKNYSKNYSLMWRSMSSASNTRTCLATILPHCPASQSIQFLQLDSEIELALALSIMNSTVFDYLVRMKMSGIDLTQTVIKQIAVPSPDLFQRKIIVENISISISDAILNGVVGLLGKDYRNRKFCDAISRQAELVTYCADPIFLDALVAHCYGISIDDYDYILSSFKLEWDKRKGIDFFKSF
ncbi:hypothetical protein HWV00_18580 [Moritella sp. 24]|uniref:hypothetical protein n=1 Tax=Moritella sp. 24 TaxID=2746230 RepID=UPI001BA8493F|nr:hypothetical protein [Moritella sp. 24]QUM78057.1 hypothetical protein HWV00_18580 [Moritella sp. 24]